MKLKIEVEVNSEAAMKYILEKIASTIFAGDAQMLTIIGEQKDR